MIRLICLLCFSFTLGATTFRPQPIQQQVRESDGVFVGHYLRKKSVLLENGSLATQMIFKMTKEVGLQSEYFGMDEVIVHYPGGKLGDRHVVVEGVPKFVAGEKVVLFIKNVDNRYWGMNLGFGTFKVINYGRDVVMVNTLFPENPTVGQVNFKDFERIVREIKGSNLKVVQNQQYPTFEGQENVKRSPASERQNRSIASQAPKSDNKDEAHTLNVFWLILILGFAGGISRMMTQKSELK